MIIYKCDVCGKTVDSVGGPVQRHLKYEIEELISTDKACFEMVDDICNVCAETLLSYYNDLKKETAVKIVAKFKELRGE